MIEFIKKIPGLRSGIGRRFILYILLFSSVITFMGTGLKLYLDYDRDLKLIHTSLKQVESSYLHSITNSLWVTDDELLHIQLEGIMRLPDMQFIEVRKGTEVLQAIGTPKSHVDLVGGPLELHDRRILPFGEEGPSHVNKPENSDE